MTIYKHHKYLDRDYIYYLVSGPDILSKGDIVKIIKYINTINDNSNKEEYRVWNPDTYTKLTDLEKIKYL